MTKKIALLEPTCLIEQNRTSFQSNTMEQNQFDYVRSVQLSSILQDPGCSITECLMKNAGTCY